MLRWSGIFLILAAIAALVAYGGIAAGAAGLAKPLLYIFIVLFLASVMPGQAKNE